MFSKLTLWIFSCSFIVLSACSGGDNDGVDRAAGIPQAVISAPDQINEGTTEIDINGSDSQDDGSVEVYLWAIEDDGGIAELQIADSAAVSTQITNIPNSLEEDITIIISLVVTDDEDNESPKVTKTITLVNETTVVVDVSSESFNGTWKSPCYNTNNKTSVEQTITILDASMSGGMRVYSAGATPAFNCVLPASSTGLIVANTTARLDFGRRISMAECTGGEAVKMSVNVSSIRVGQLTYTTTSEIAGTLALLAPTANILPNSTNVCVLTNGNLLYGGKEYTRAG